MVHQNRSAILKKSLNSEILLFSTWLGLRRNSVAARAIGSFRAIIHHNYARIVERQRLRRTSFLLLTSWCRIFKELQSRS